MVRVFSRIKKDSVIDSTKQVILLFLGAILAGKSISGSV